MSNPFRTFRRAVLIGAIALPILIVLVMCGGSSASVQTVEEESAHTAEQFSLAYSAADGAPRRDIAEVNMDGVSEEVSLLALYPKEAAVVTHLVVLTDELAAAVQMEAAARSDETSDATWTATARAGDTGFELSLSCSLAADEPLCITFSQTVLFQGIIVGYQN